MPAFNVVKFKIKPGRENDFLDAHRNGKAAGSTMGADPSTGRVSAHQLANARRITVVGD